MPFQKPYSKNEAQFMLQVYEGSRAFLNAHGGVVTRHGAPSHPALHGGAGFGAQRTRVTTPGQPRTTGTFLTADKQAEALAFALNDPIGQAELATMDANPAVRDIRFTVALPAGAYRMSTHHDDSDIGAGAAGHLVRNDPGRAGGTSTRTIAFATHIFVYAIRAPGGKLQIQTCYPS